MAIQNDNTLVTKGDLKSLYTDKIAPYLGGGINYYQCDRSGEELKSCYASLDSNWSTSLANVPMIKRSGTIVQPSVGLFTIPAGSTVEIIYSHSASSPSGDFVMGIYNNTDSVWITNRDGANGLKDFCPYHITSGSNTYCMGDSYTIQWTNDTGHNVDISLRVNANSIPGSIREDYAGLSIKEIGRVVDPVKYVSNNSDLQETPVGNIISYMGNTVPKHYLACDGTLYSIGTYPELEAFIIDEFGSINYFGGNGTTNWAVPDLRGEFLRGSGTNSHTNQGSGLAVGSHQNATEVPYIGVNTSSTYCVWTSSVGQSSPSSHGIQPVNTDSGIKGSNTTSTKGYQGAVNSIKTTWDNAGNLSNYTTRPTNTSVKYCIKYESTYHAFFSNAAYKVEASFGLNYNSTLQSYVSYAMSYITGDSSLMNENYFIAPVDGWYMVSFKSNQISYNKPAVQYLQINDVSADAFTDATGSGTSHSNFGVNMTHTIYLSKGDKVNYRVWTNGNTITLPSVRRASFCLLTSNYNPTIVSANTVYSENEQMIGYWKDGKPLYQKTFVITTPSSTNYAQVISTIHADCDLIVNFWGLMQGSTSNRMRNGNEIGANRGEYFDIWADGKSIYALVDGGHTNKTAYITVQYTKTTDTANSLQVENSLLLNRPDLWTPGTEYHFGGGLYGKRISGTMNTTTGVPSYTTIYANFNGNVVSYGGSIRRSVGGNWDFAIPCSYKNNTTVMTGGVATQLSGNVRTLVFYFTDSADMSNVPYDVWVTYKK